MAEELCKRKEKFEEGFEFMEIFGALELLQNCGTCLELLFWFVDNSRDFFKTSRGFLGRTSLEVYFLELIGSFVAQMWNM